MDRRAEELNDILSSINGIRAKQIGNVSLPHTVEKLERRVDQVQKTENSSAAQTKFGPLMGMSLKDHIRQMNTNSVHSAIRPVKVAKSHGRDTFDDRQVELCLGKLDGRANLIERAQSRDQRARVHDTQIQGADVGKYNPKFN